MFIRDTVLVGIRFLFHDFIPIILADVQINFFQLAPNTWRLIICFMSSCFKKKLSLSLVIFRKIFQFINSANNTPGWVFINQRPSMKHIGNGLSIPDNNFKWKEKFVYLECEGDDWGTLFRSSFRKVMDGSPNKITLTIEEQVTFEALTEDDGKTHSWDLLNETTLRELKLSPVFAKGNFLLFLFFE